MTHISLVTLVQWDILDAMEVRRGDTSSASGERNGASSSRESVHTQQFCTIRSPLVHTYISVHVYTAGYSITLPFYAYSHTETSRNANGLTWLRLVPCAARRTCPQLIPPVARRVQSLFLSYFHYFFLFFSFSFTSNSHSNSPPLAQLSRLFNYIDICILQPFFLSNYLRSYSVTTEELQKLRRVYYISTLMKIYFFNFYIFTLIKS